MSKVLAKSLTKAERAFHSPSRPVYNARRTGSPFSEFEKELPNDISTVATLSSTVYRVYGKVGDFQFSEIPWAGIFDRSITTSARRGVYIVFLFSTDGKSVYLSLNQGFNFFSDLYKSKAIDEIQKMAAYLRTLVGGPKFLDIIDLHGTTINAKGYEAGHIIGFKYDLASMPDDAKIVKDIYDLLTAYAAIKSDMGSRSFDDYYKYLIATYSGVLPGTVPISFPAASSTPVKKKKVAKKTTSPSTSTVIEDAPIAKGEPVIDREAKLKYPRSLKVKDDAKIAASYCCEHAPSHKTFLSSDGVNNYVEAHHLIPMQFQDDFSFSLDVPANVVALCSLCHDQIHHGETVGKNVILRDLWNKRKDRLDKAGLKIDVVKLLDYYKVEIEDD